MSVLSITFHAIEDVRQEWDKYLDEQMIQMVENLMDVDQYILSDVDSKMINEGSNSNLLLIFENDSLREDFIQSEFLNLEDRIKKEFAGQVMIFMTLLNPKKARL